VSAGSPAPVEAKIERERENECEREKVCVLVCLYELANEKKELTSPCNDYCLGPIGLLSYFRNFRSQSVCQSVSQSVSQSVCQSVCLLG